MPQKHKLLNLTTLQVEFEKLQEQKEALYTDYEKLKKHVKEYDVIKQNIDSILRQPKGVQMRKGSEKGIVLLRWKKSSICDIIFMLQHLFY